MQGSQEVKYEMSFIKADILDFILQIQLDFVHFENSESDQNPIRVWSNSNWILSTYSDLIGVLVSSIEI